jgi:glycosyltransferase involved in cell wall biosynthesis
MSLAPNTPFVVFGDDWNRYPSTMQHTFRHIATKYPVVWINGIGHRVPRLNLKDLRRVIEKLARIAGTKNAPPAVVKGLGKGEPVAVIEPRVLPWHNVPAVKALNTMSLMRSVAAVMRTHGLERRPVLVTGSPPSVGVVGQLNELASVYFVMDDFLNFPSYTAQMLEPLERELLERVDLVVATAASLTRSKRPRSGRAVHLPQGVNYEHFAEARPEPADLASIPRPRIGFAGTLSTQCDLDLLQRLAAEFPDASLVLVGPVAFDDAALSPLRRGNVHTLGVRPYAELPAYVQHFDVGIIPYVISAWTVAVDPLKLLEYLAAGIPVVTTAIPEAAKYSEYVTIASDTAQFVEGVRRALGTDPAASRARGQTLARQNGWDTRADTLLRLVQETVDAKRPETLAATASGAAAL